MRPRKRSQKTGWAITFADLMGLLVSFFVMLTILLVQKKEEFSTTQHAFQRVFGKNMQEVIVRLPPLITPEQRTLEQAMRAALAKDETLAPLLQALHISHDKDLMRIEIKAPRP